MPTSIAAAVAMAIAGVVVLMPHATVSAAEALEEIADAQHAYDGWMHLTLDAQQSKFQSPAGVEAKNVAAAEHYHTTRKVHIGDESGDGKRYIRWWSPRELEWTEYSSDTGEVRIGAMAEVTAKSILENPPPVTIAQAIRHLRKSKGLDRLNVQSAMDGKLERFVITFPPEAQELCKQGGCPVPERITMWVDPQTRMIQRGLGKVGANTYAYNVTYGPPDFKSILDLGLPEGVKVVDNRPKADTESVLERLRQRYKKGFGNFTAVLIEDQTFWLMAQSGEAWLANHYLVGGQQDESAHRRKISLPAPSDWPQTGVQALATLALYGAPAWYATYDGDRFWTGFRAPYKGEDQYDGKGEVRNAKGDSFMTSVRRQFDLPGRIWETPERLGAVGPDSSIDLVRDTDRPHLIGVRITSYSIPDVRKYHEKSRRETTTWLDPSRDDMPVESISHSYEIDGKSTRTQGRTEYLDYAQLPSGQWYPTHWRSIYSYQGKYQDIRESHLRIYPDVQLEPEWFTDPLSRRKPADPTEPAKP